MKNILSGLKSSVSSLEAADTARDSRDWKRARDCYEAFLKANPSRSDIWVQLGHARKELGDFSGADAAYRHSLLLDEFVADTHLQLGHVLKLQGKIDEAVEAYAKALELDPKMSAARLELRALGVHVAAPSVDSKRILIDLSDVFFYLQHHKTVSGIQRVQLGLATAIIQAKDSQVAFITERFDHSGYIEVEHTLVLGLIRTLKKLDVIHSELQDLGRRAGSEGNDYRPVKGDLLLVLGAFWVLPNIIERIISLKSMGARVGVMIHDIIPITHPEFCERSLTETFHLYIRSTLRIVDVIISISEYTQNEIKKLLTKEGIDLPEMFVLRNAHVSWEVPERKDLAKSSPEIESIIRQPYVLYVSTIEIRKNHTLLFRVWKHLIEELAGRLPRLVFLGRPGWRVNDLMEQIIGTDYLDGRISILHDISDRDLGTLYRHAMFTTFPSFVEGWGLPIGESLVFGRPCLASNLSSIPEVGREFVDYFDPNDLSSALGAFRRMLGDVRYLTARTEFIASRFQARTWTDAAAELLPRVHKILAATPPDTEQTVRDLIPFLAPGKTYQVGHKDQRSSYINGGFGTMVYFVFDSNWYPVENFGRWLAGGKGSIHFKNETRKTGSIRIILGLSTVGWYNNNSLQITVGENPFKPFNPPAGEDFEVVIDLKLEGSLVDIHFSVGGSICSGPDPRVDLSIGLRTIAYAKADDLEARLSLLEEAMAERSNVVRLA